MDHHRAARLAHRGGNGFHVQRGEAAQIEDFERGAFARGGLGGGERDLYRRPVGNHRCVAPFARNAGAIQRGRRQRQGDLLAQVVARLGLEEDHRVGVADGGGEQGIGVSRCGG